jgi:hypothetical protein
LTRSLAGNGFAREYGAAATTASACITGFVAAIFGRRKYSSVVPYRECGANIHGALSSIYLFRRFRLLEEEYAGLVGVVGDEIRRFFETETTQRAAGIHIPFPKDVLRLLDQFVRHDSSKLRITLKKVGKCP